eukprot:5977642-Alexandrium_andersonii.AAC.1
MPARGPLRSRGWGQRLIGSSSSGAPCTSASSSSSCCTWRKLPASWTSTSWAPGLAVRRCMS